jgi:hypothetical protein
VRNSTTSSEDIQIELECQDVDDWANETNSTRGGQTHDIADGVDLPLTTILEMFPETVEPIGEDQKQLYHELALNIQTLAHQQTQPIHDLIRQSATIFKQRTEFDQHQQLLHMLSTYAPEPRPALVNDDWMTTVRGNDKIMPSMDMGYVHVVYIF